MSDVIRNATIRLAIEYVQSQLTLPNLNEIVAGQKAMAASSQEVAAAVQQESAALQVATQTNNTYAGSQVMAYRGAANLVRGLALVGVATGELDAKAMQSIVAIEGMASAFKGAAEMAKFFKVELAPFLLIGTAVVAVAYEIEQAWTADARAAKAAAEQAEKNLKAPKEDADRDIEIIQAYIGWIKRKEAAAINAADEQMRANERVYQQEQRFIDRASSIFEMKPGERARLARDLNQAAAGGIGSLSARELVFLGKDPGSRDAVHDEELSRLHGLGFPASIKSERTEAHRSSVESHEDKVQGVHDATNTMIAQLIQVINVATIQLRQMKEQLEQQKQGAIAHQAASSVGSGPSFTPSTIQFTGGY